MAYGTLVLLLGVGCQEENVAPPKTGMETRNPGSWAFRWLRLKPHGTCEALELKSRRLSRQSRPLVPAGDLVKQGFAGFKGSFCGGPVLGNPCRCQRLQDLDIIMSGF